ncbi:MAG: hypothetical protein IPJ13_10615 [Saprospiraceae bacterium]|nr:hypothetical protein [Saprospiraceae bacterium]
MTLPLYQFTLDTLSAYQGASVLYHNEDIYSSPLPYPELEYKKPTMKEII